MLVAERDAIYESVLPRVALILEMSNDPDSRESRVYVPTDPARVAT